MTILVATDFSPSSQPATEVAAALARRLGDTLVLAHVFESMAARVPEIPIDAHLDQALREQARESLERASAALAVRGARVEPRLVDGPPVEEALNGLARELGARLIVVGTHGRRGLARAALGSVAEATVVTSGCPVLVVPAASTERLISSFAADRPLRVVAAVDCSAASAAAVEWIRSLRAAIPCDVTYVHLYWPAEEYTRLGLVGWRSMLRPDPTTVGILEHDLVKVLGDERRESRLRVLPTWGAPGDHLAADAQALGADLLVMGTRQQSGLRRFWLGSAVHGTLRAATLPVLCVPPPQRSPRQAPVPEIRRVLAPTDLSDVANRAIPQAYALARGAHGTVHLCHVHEAPLPSPIYAYDRSAKETLPAAETEAVRAALLDLVPADAEGLGIETTIEIIDGGDAAKAICQAANRLGVDAICLGSHGRGGLGQALLGSVAAKVVQHAEQPVHIVRTPRAAR